MYNFMGRSTIAARPTHVSPRNAVMNGSTDNAEAVVEISNIAVRLIAARSGFFDQPSTA
jgi:hypothetical protein